MKRKLIAVCILTLFSAEVFGQAIITKAAEISLNQNSAIASSTPSPTGTPSTTGTPVSTGTVASNNNQDNLKDVGSYKNENFEYNVKKDDTHKYIELSYYIGSNHSVIIPDKIDGISVEVLKSGLFAFNKIDVYDVTIPESVKLIQYRTFDGTIDSDRNIYYGSSTLRNVKILGKDTRLEDNAFYNCNHLRDVEADNSVFDNADCRMFCSNNNFNTKNIKNDVFFILGNKLVNTVGDGAYKALTPFDRRNINISIPDGVKIIGKDCFKNSMYKVVEIPKSVEKIEKGAFKDCDIERIYIPNPNVVIEDGAFDNNIEIYIGDKKPIDNNIFNYSCTQEGRLKKCYANDKILTIPSEINKTKITSIGGEFVRQPFAGSYLEYRDMVFGPWSKAEKIIIPEGVTEINDYSFLDCPNLKEVVIPSTVTKISKNAFDGCYNLIKITEAKNIITDCEEYNKAIANNGKEKETEYKYYNGFKYYIDNDKTVTIVDYTGNDKKLIIPDKIDGIRVAKISSIDNNNIIEEVVIPSSVAEISGFNNCSSLKDVTIQSEDAMLYCCFENTPYLDNIFKNNNGLYIYNKKIEAVSKDIDTLVVPEGVSEINNKYYPGLDNFKEVDLTSKTKVTLYKPHEDYYIDTVCKSLDDYKEFARQIQKQNDYYFTLKLDGNVIWSNEEGVGTDTPDNKNRPERFEITKTADSKNAIVLVVVLSSSLVIAFKLKNKIKL